MPPEHEERAAAATPAAAGSSAAGSSAAGSGAAGTRVRGAAARGATARRAAGTALSVAHRWWRALLRVLRRTPFPRPTSRGWTVIAVGVGLVGGGLVATTSVAVTGGLLLLVLVVLGAVVAYSVAAPLRAVRVAPRDLVQVGEVHRERLDLSGRTGLAPTSRLLVRERLEDHFVGLTDVDTVVELGAATPVVPVEFEAIAVHRGRSVVGPVTVRAEDPFGLLRIDRVVVPASDVVVVPRSVPLAALDAGALAGAVSADEGRVGQGGSADDSELRVYRPGDPIRRVHWGQSAKRGELHVRQTTQAQPPEAIVVLDVLRSSYQQLGRDDFAELSDLGGDHAFEHAVVVAASVARALAARTSRVRLVTDGGGPDGADRGADHDAPRARSAVRDSNRAGHRPGDAAGLTEVLVALAEVELRSDATRVEHVLPDPRQREAHGMTAVVTGQCSAEQAAELVARGSSGSTGIVATIVPPDAATRGVLDRAGWRILVVPVPGATPTGSVR